MNQKLHEYRQPARRDYGFAIGVLTGTCIGAGLALWFAPRIAAELRERVAGSAKDLGQRVSDGYEQVSTRIAGAADAVTQKGQDVRDHMADAVAQGAHEVERFANAAKTR